MNPVEPVWAAPFWFVAGVAARVLFDEWWQHHRQVHTHRKRRRGGR